MSSHQYVRAHHAAQPQDADHNADEMHGLVPDQQEEPGEQNHNWDHETIQELLGGRKEQQEVQEEGFHIVEKNSSVKGYLLPLNLRFCVDPELMQL